MTIYYYKGHEIDRKKTAFVLPPFSAKKKVANEKFIEFTKNKYKVKVDSDKSKLHDAVKTYGLH